MITPFEKEKYYAVNNGKDIETSVWLPRFEFIPGKYSNAIVLDSIKERRLVIDGLLQLVHKFSIDSYRRKKLGQDCLAFAHAWEKGDDPDRLFASAGGKPMHPRELSHETNNTLKPPPSTPGDIIFTTDAPITKEGHLVGRTHFLVHATDDDREPLYMAKLGYGGPVVLTTFEQSRHFYPALTAGIARDFQELEGRSDSDFVVHRS